MSEAKPIHVLFLCTRNSARSILAEACLNQIGKGRFKAYSAGSAPTLDHHVHPYAVDVLKAARIPVGELRSKHWSEFAGPDASHMDLVVTICEDMAKEGLPQLPGQPATAYWGYPDPVAVDGSGSQQAEAFRQTLHSLRRRLELLVQLPEGGIDKLMLEQSAREIAKA